MNLSGITESIPKSERYTSAAPTIAAALVLLPTLSVQTRLAAIPVKPDT